MLAVDGNRKRNGTMKKTDKCFRYCTAAAWIMLMWFLVAGALLFTLATWKVLKWWNWL